MRPIASRPQTSLTYRAAVLAALLLTGPAVADTTTAPTAPAPPTVTPGQPQIAELYAGDVRSLLVHPDQPDLVLAGTSGGQVYRSTDGGAHWTNAGAVLPFQGWVVGTLMWDPDRKDRIWAGLWGVWGGGRVVYSEDLGATWRSRAKGLPEGPIYALAAVPGRPGHLYAASLTGVYSTVDDGLSWQHATRDFPEVHNVSSLLVDPFDGNTVIAGTWRRAFRSTDGWSCFGGACRFSTEGEREARRYGSPSMEPTRFTNDLGRAQGPPLRGSRNIHCGPCRGGPCALPIPWAAGDRSEPLTSPLP